MALLIRSSMPARKAARVSRDPLGAATTGARPPRFSGQARWCVGVLVRFGRAGEAGAQPGHNHWVEIGPWISIDGGIGGAMSCA